MLPLPVTGTIAVTRTTYFNSDEIHFFKKDLNIFDRIQVSHMAQFKMHWISLPLRSSKPSRGTSFEIALVLRHSHDYRLVTFEGALPELLRARQRLLCQLRLS